MGAGLLHPCPLGALQRGGGPAAGQHNPQQVLQQQRNRERPPAARRGALSQPLIERLCRAPARRPSSWTNIPRSARASAGYSGARVGGAQRGGQQLPGQAARRRAHASAAALPTGPPAAAWVAPGRADRRPSIVQAASRRVCGLGRARAAARPPLDARPVPCTRAASATAAWACPSWRWRYPAARARRRRSPRLGTWPTCTGTSHPAGEPPGASCRRCCCSRCYSSCRCCCCRAGCSPGARCRPADAAGDAAAALPAGSCC
jgi:hypothetical protein